MNACLTCGSKDVDPRNVYYMCNPGVVIVPCAYILCDEHKDLRYDFYDIYDENFNRKEIDHEYVIKRNNKDNY
jgi:hypothetical protein